MKQFSAVLTFLTFVAASVVAQQPLPPAGVTPDNPFYGLDVAFDRLRLLIASGETEKARVGLEIASERLSELRVMIEQKKLDATERARTEYKNFLDEVNRSVRAIEVADPLEEAERVTIIERELEEHEDVADEVLNELKVKIKIEGALTEEQRNRINSILENVQNLTGRVKVEIEAKKDETKIKIVQRTGLSETEADERIAEIEKRVELFEIRERKAAKKIADAREELIEALDILATSNLTEAQSAAVGRLLNESQAKLNNAELAFNKTRFGEAFGQATAAERLAENAQKILKAEEEVEPEEEVEEETEIEVEVEEGAAKVKIEVGDEKLKFRIQTDNRERIISEIASKTGLSEEEIKRIVKFEFEKEIKEQREKIEKRLKILEENRENISKIREEIRRISEIEKVEDESEEHEED